jgi:iron complex outermembrane receptor protein
MFISRLKNSVSLFAILAAATVPHNAQAQMVAANDAMTAQNNVFDLGQIEQVTITASPLSQAISRSVVTGEETFKFNALTVDRAVDLAAGVQSGSTGGPRNERLFFVRGFDRFQSPLFVDGIRVYLPVDNRLDAGFFLTANLAQIQIDKGYVSVMSGPGALGGAINLVTSKPTQPFQYDARAGIQLGNEGYNGYNMSGLLGGATEKSYWQASGAVTKTDHWALSDSFTPTASENGGIRDHSDARNYNLNFKVGATPNATDEYSLSYSGQWGKKDATLSTIDTVATQKDWTWPYWDVQSLYFLSNTTIGNTAYVKTKLYYNSFRNATYSYDNANYNTQTTTKAFDSYYSDYGFGGSIEVGNEFFDGRDILKGALFFRRDNHVEWQQIFVPKFTEPHQQSEEDTYSAALENRFRVTDQVDFVLGASYDWRHLLIAQDFVDPTPAKPGVFVNYPLADGHAPNAQGAVIYNYSDTGHVYANVSDRSRFPTLFERFSTRFNSTLSNPNLKAERAVNYEIGGGDTLFGNTRFDAAVFYSDVTNALENVPIIFCDTTSNVTPKNCPAGGPFTGVNTPVNQTQNVGNGKYIGFELSADSRLLDEVQAGVRLTYINRSLDAQNPANPPLPVGYHLTGVAPVQAFAYVTWDVLSDLSLTPSVEIASERWSNLAGNMNVFLQTGSFVLVNFTAQYAVTDRIDIQVGARNLLDENYSLVAGFPSEGRNFFLNLRIRS